MPHGNLGKHVQLASRRHGCPTGKLTESQKATRALQAAQWKIKKQALYDYVDEFYAIKKKFITTIANDHGHTEEYAARILSNTTQYKDPRQEIVAKPFPSRTSPQPADKVAHLPRSKEVARLKGQLQEERELTHVGFRANNLAAGADLRAIVNRIQDEIMNLHMRTGTRCVACSHRGNVDDQFIPTLLASTSCVYLSSGAVCKIKRDSMVCMKTEITQTHDLQPKCKQEAQDKDELRELDTDIKMAWKVKLVGWPDDIPFVKPSELGTGDHRELEADIERRRAAGTLHKARKPRTDKGGKHKVHPGAVAMMTKTRMRATMQTSPTTTITTTLHPQHVLDLPGSAASPIVIAPTHPSIATPYSTPHPSPPLLRPLPPPPRPTFPWACQISASTTFSPSTSATSTSTLSNIPTVDFDALVSFEGFGSGSVISNGRLRRPSGAKPRQQRWPLPRPTFFGTSHPFPSSADDVPNDPASMSSGTGILRAPAALPKIPCPPPSFVFCAPATPNTLPGQKHKKSGGDSDAAPAAKKPRKSAGSSESATAPPSRNPSARLVATKGSRARERRWRGRPWRTRRQSSGTRGWRKRRPVHYGRSRARGIALPLPSIARRDSRGVRHLPPLRTFHPSVLLDVLALVPVLRTALTPS
ncbi:hypothetical protein B0H14DRAFT_3529967 [Mycena olivaceomarginata]|nr:hypothetical protein B0H14DRAFT_3529967 [Mycena olivaceomarginata]